MNSQTALNIFDNALSIMGQYARVQLRADTLTVLCSAFNSFAELINAEGHYRPSLSRAGADTRELGALYDAAQIARGDDRRAFMYGTPVRKGSIIDTANYDAGQSWYRQGQRIAWWDRYTRQWIAYTVDADHNQVGPCDLYRNQGQLLQGEHCHA